MLLTQESQITADRRIKKANRPRLNRKGSAMTAVDGELYVAFSNTEIACKGVRESDTG